MTGGESLASRKQFQVERNLGGAGDGRQLGK